MPSFTEIGQMSLSHLGSGRSIADVDTEQSEEARVLRLFKDTALRKVLSAAPWPFCTQIVTLTLSEEDPNDEWDFSYVHPTTAILIRRIVSGTRTDVRETRVPFRVANATSGRVIWTDEASAKAEITVYKTDTSLFTPEFVLALSYYWAYLIAPRVTKGDSTDLKKKMLAYFKQEIAEAIARSFNEEQPDIEPDSEFIRSRN
jgi:hypothetical protein